MMIPELLLQWRRYAGVKVPPAEPVLLWNEKTRTICLSNSWGPAVPYPTIVHEDGTQNYGYQRLKGDPEAIRRLPEAFGWPELQEFLAALNAAESPIESVGCERAYFPVENPAEDGPTVYLGSYIDVVFTNVALNDTPENSLLLASHLTRAAKDCECWWSTLEIELQRFRALPGATAPWGLMLRIMCHGRDKDEARKGWGETLRRLTQAVTKLPKDMRWEGTDGPW